MFASPPPSLNGISRSRNGKTYRLEVVQHPQRARMCGFGDRDRRPLSPSLIVKLIITDQHTGVEVNVNQVNSSLFFLAADLCHAEELTLAPRNLLVHQLAGTSNAAIPVKTEQDSGAPGMTRLPSDPFGYVGQPHSSAVGLKQDAKHEIKSEVKQEYKKEQSWSENEQASTSTAYTGYPSEPTAMTTAAPREQYIRNLVGAAVTSAHILRDQDERLGVFFVLQDLSVRTEGVYRIRLLFTDLANDQGTTFEGRTEALAEAFTDPFTVYSPRRFPGMLEPTELSRRFASQGVKIAVRSDKKKRTRGGSDDEGQAASQEWSHEMGGGQDTMAGKSYGPRGHEMEDKKWSSMGRPG